MPLPPLENKPPGFFVECFDQNGQVTTSVPPAYCTNIAHALSWFRSQIEGVQNAQPDWVAATTKEVRLTWTAPHNNSDEGNDNGN